jgi:DNA replication protein DnaC
LLHDFCLSEPLWTFANFELLPGTAQAYEAVRQIADGNSKASMLLLYGGSGCGKTHLLKAAILRLYGRGIFVRYLTWSRLVNTLKEGFHDSVMPPYWQRLGNYCYAMALVIDDVGLGSNGTDWEYSQLEEIIDIRYDQRLLTSMATNKHLS